MNDHKEESFVSAIVYLHDHQDFAAPFLHRLAGLLREHFLNYEIICVDDGSTDDTLPRLRQAARETEGCMVSIVKLNSCQGYEAAMNAGTDLAIGDYLFEFDSPVMDYDPALILQVYRKTGEGYDIVSASNRLYKRASSRLFYNIFNKNAKLQYAIGSESFRVVSRRAVNKAASLGRSVRYRKAFYANCGLKTCRISYDGDRALLRSRDSNAGHRADTAAASLILFTDVAYKASIGIALFMMLATVFMAVYALVVFISRRAIEGFTTTMLVMTGSFFGVFALMAVIIKYLSVIVEMVFEKQEYRVESVEKISK